MPGGRQLKGYGANFSSRVETVLVSELAHRPIGNHLVAMNTSPGFLAWSAAG